MRRALACLSFVLLLPACTGEDKPSATSTSPTPPVVVATAKPKVTVPQGAPPTNLVQTDLVVGTGAALVPGQVASVHYVGVLHRNGEEFDSSWETGHPFAFRVGDGEVITGWDKGVLGMRVGGRRMLVIPPSLGYGEQPGHELQNETLVFVIDAVATGGAPAQIGED